MQRLIPSLVSLGSLGLALSIGAATPPPSRPVAWDAPIPGAAAIVPLWQDGPPGFQAQKDAPESLSGTSLSGIHNPSMTVFLPEKGSATGDAVIILPGGGHRFLSIEKEGYDVGRWCAAHGIAGLVVTYRLAKEPGSVFTVETDALHDVQRAVRLARLHAGDWGFNPVRVGVLGFSAGGEVAALASMRHDSGDPKASDPLERQECRPFFQALIYPGGSPRITPSAGDPAAFLAAGGRDRPDISEGVPEAYLRFKKAGVPADLHVFTGVGHGFGLGHDLAAAWPELFRAWLRALK